MPRRIQLFATAALCIGTYAMAASPPIGTVTAHGETRIDHYAVNSSGTVFDGSVIETELSDADLRLASNGAVVTLFSNSRGILYRDHFVLDRGKIKLSSSKPFSVQAGNLAVVPDGDSSGVVTVEDNNSVVVMTEKGTLDVRNAAGTRIAQVHSGLSFTSTGKASSAIGETVPSRNNQHDLPAVDANVVPSLLMLPGPSSQSSSEIRAWSISQSIPSGNSCVQGAGGGCCPKSQLEKCCGNKFPNNKQLCCPGMPLSPKQCGASN